MNDLVNRLRKMAGIETSALFSQRETLNEAASRISQQDAELERLRREVEEAREALKPFADEAACYDPDEGDGDDNVWAAPVYFKIRDLRNARALRAKSEETRT